MESGTVRFLAILVGALVIGMVVLVIRPEYRGAVVARWHGRPHDSPIWRSNARYYPAIGHTEPTDEP